MAKNQFQMHFLWLSFRSRWCQKFPFKNVFFFDHRVQNVPQVSSETPLPCLVQNKPSAPIRRVENKVEFLERQFRLSTKRKLSILLNLLFPFVSFIGVFSILKCKTLVLKITTWWTRASHFDDGWHLLRCKTYKQSTHFCLFVLRLWPWPVALAGRARVHVPQCLSRNKLK